MEGRMAQTFPIAPNDRMVTYYEALVVNFLHVFHSPSCLPEDDGIVVEVLKDINYFFQSIKDQRFIFNHRMDKGEIVCYSNRTKRPLDKNVALDLIAQGNTSDLLIFGNDLLCGEQYPANLLPKVIKNAKAIISQNSSIQKASTSTGTYVAQISIINQCSIFKTMEKLTVDELTISFVGDKNESVMGANNMLEISARGQTRRVALATIDLIDLHRCKINKQCNALLDMAQKSKSPNTPAGRKIISRLRDIFKKHLGVSDDPFDPYRIGVGWEPRFKIYDKRGAAEKRAENEARRKTVSFEESIEKGTQFVDNKQRDKSSDLKNDAAAKWLKLNDPDLR